jgi:hypothetical protein
MGLVIGLGGGSGGVIADACDNLQDIEFERFGRFNLLSRNLQSPRIPDAIHKGIAPCTARNA